MFSIGKACCWDHAGIKRLSSAHMLIVTFRLLTEIFNEFKSKREQDLGRAKAAAAATVQQSDAAAAATGLWLDVVVTLS